MTCRRVISIRNAVIALDDFDSAGEDHAVFVPIVAHHAGRQEAALRGVDLFFEEGARTPVEPEAAGPEGRVKLQEEAFVLRFEPGNAGQVERREVGEAKDGTAGVVVLEVDAGDAIEYLFGGAVQVVVVSGQVEVKGVVQGKGGEDACTEGAPDVEFQHVGRPVDQEGGGLLPDTVDAEGNPGFGLQVAEALCAGGDGVEEVGGV